MKKFRVVPKTLESALAIVSVARQCGATGSVALYNLVTAANNYITSYPTIVFTLNGNGKTYGGEGNSSDSLTDASSGPVLTVTDAIKTISDVFHETNAPKVKLNDRVTATILKDKILVEYGSTTLELTQDVLAKLVAAAKTVSGK